MILLSADAVNDVERLRRFLDQTNPDAARRIRHQADPVPGQLQHRALLVGQHDRACAAADRQARTGSVVDAGDVARAVDVADAAAPSWSRG